MLTKKKSSASTKSRSTYTFLWNGVEIASVITYKDYVKRKETDTILTKFTRLQDIRWNKQGLAQLFPAKSDEISTIRDQSAIESKEGSATFWIEIQINRLK